MTRHISWQVELNGEYARDAVILRRDVVGKEVQRAGDLCVHGLVRHFGLGEGAEAGMNQAFATSMAWLTSGNEGPAMRPELPVGPLKSNVVDIFTREKKEVPDQTPEVRISLEGIEQEAENLYDAAIRFKRRGRYEGVSDPTAETLERWVTEADVLVGSATRLATARRMLRYILLPDGALTDEQRAKVGFETWFTQQTERLSLGKRQSNAKKKAVRQTYAEENLAIKNLRRSAWTPLFFATLGIDSSELVFYMTYRDILSRNCQSIVTFSSALVTQLTREETKDALEAVFNPPKPRALQ